jgi:hypothetical protein
VKTLVDRLCCLAALVVAGACSAPVRPTSTVVAAAPTSPPDGTQFSFYEQPVRLSVRNGARTGTGPANLTFAIATDRDFRGIVQSKVVPMAPNGQTEVVLETLAPNREYFLARLGGPRGPWPGRRRGTANRSIHPC